MPSKEFTKAAEDAKKLKAKPSQDELLKLYAYYKQALQNPPFNPDDKPSAFNFKEKYKFNAWQKVVDEKVTPKDAEKQYIQLVEQLKGTYGYDSSKEPEALGAS